MSGTGRADDAWHETLCGVQVQFRRQDLNWDWCKKCLGASELHTKQASGKVRRQVVHIVELNFQPSVSVIRLIEGENSHVVT